MSTDVVEDTPESTPESPSEAPKRKVGRPRKADITKKKRGSRGAIGRPKGDAAIINEYKARMLASPKSRAVLDTIFDAALNDEHKNQAAAWKLVMDRVAPVAAFEKEVVKSGATGGIKIEITGVPGVNIEGTRISDSDSEAIDADFEPVDAGDTDGPDTDICTDGGTGDEFTE